MENIIIVVNWPGSENAESIKRKLGIVSETHDGYVTKEQWQALLNEELQQTQISEDLNSHKNNKANPHTVTATQVGLGNVNNTSDINKPISNTQQAALDLKASINYVNQKVTEVSTRSFLGYASPTFMPAVPTTSVWYKGTAGATYINFKDSNNNPLVIPLKVGVQYVDAVELIWNTSTNSWIAQYGLFDALNKIPLFSDGIWGAGSEVEWVGKYWIANVNTVQGEIPGASTKWREVLTAYGSKTQVDANTKSISDNFNVASSTVNRGTNFNTTTYVPAWYNTTSIFSGNGNPIGAPAIKFNSVDITIRTRATAVTKFYTRLTKVSKTGDVIATKNMDGLNLAPNTVHVVRVTFDSQIDNTAGEQLYLSYCCDQFIDAWGFNGNGPFNYSAYPRGSWSTNGTMGFPLAGDNVPVEGYNSVFLVTFYENATVATPNSALTNTIKSAVEAANPDLITLPASTILLNKTSKLITVFTGSEIFPASSAVVADTISTFSGWASPIGVRNNFTHIINKVKARATAITSIYFELREVDKDGLLLASGTIATNILPGVLADVTYPMGSNIVNPLNKRLYFGFKCNQLCDNFGLASEFVFPYPDYGQAAYVTNGSQTPNVWTLVSSGATRNLWANVGVIDQVATPTAEFLAQLQSLIIVPPPTNVIVPTAEIILNSRVYALEGKQTNIYFANIIQSNIDLSLLDINVTCSKGAQLEKCFRLTPIAADAGTHAITISVAFKGLVLASYSGSLLIAAMTAGTGVNRNVNNFGDSTRAGGQDQSIIISELTGDPMTINFRGELGTAPNKHEGRGGWTITDYGTVGRTFFKFPVTGVVTVPSLGATYTNNGSTFAVREINITAGAGYISCERTLGTNNPTADGVLTRTSGIGDATLNFTASSTTSGNPLWNAGTGLVDYANYLTTKGITMVANDIFTIHLGINDFFGYVDDVSLLVAMDTKITQLKNILSKVHTAVAGIICGVVIPIMPAISQDAFGANYTTGQTRKRYIKNITTYQKRLISEFDKDSERTAGNYLIPYNAVLDTENNVPRSTVNANSRSAVQIVTWTNGVHPDQTGYDQLADQLKAFIKYRG